MAEDGLIHPDDGQMISEKIVEMCDRVKRMDKFVPGTIATLALETGRRGFRNLGGFAEERLMLEDSIESQIVHEAEADGWLCRKVKWIGRVAAMDRFFAKAGRVVLIEFKATGEEPRTTQRLEIKRFLKAGVEVHVCDSVAKARKVLRLGRGR